MAGGMVAEKKNVCRGRRGRWAMIFRISGRKPMSSIRSASSSTSTSSRFQAAVLPAEVVQEPARRRHQDVHAALERVDLRAHGHAAEDGRHGQVRVRRQRPRVVLHLRRQLPRRDHTSARVAPRPRPSSRCRMGSTNAAVFPLPVAAQPSTSRPASAGGIAAL
jgi:hypothetical protein